MFTFLVFEHDKEGSATQEYYIQLQKQKDHIGVLAGKGEHTLEKHNKPKVQPFSTWGGPRKGNYRQQTNRYKEIVLSSVKEVGARAAVR